MSWEKDALLAKSKLFFEQAFQEEPDDWRFGLWCALGLELLARAAVASNSPVLLADPDPDQSNILYALGKAGKIGGKSIGSARVVQLCERLFDGFTKDHVKVCLALINRRNDELHTGAAAFSQYPSSQWLASFYSACRALCAEMQESLESLLGAEQAAIAITMLEEVKEELKQSVDKRIGSHRSVFLAKPSDDQNSAKDKAVKQGEVLAYQGHHRVECPACKCVALVQGDVYGQVKVEHSGDEIVLRQSVSPKSLYCDACGLRLTSYGELDAAGLGGHHSRKTAYSPDEYYGLVDPSSPDFDPTDYFDVDTYLARLQEQEYDNE
ncbi:hypothetical protein [Botrimarina mediterranea]|uniref:hypothetical protein n=1 Tax=Botrimarina mediterranea TaxID=2528022 RepID=UPI00118D07E8|nr:hypothetical protein K2D_08740 [Planctomycetes bacterium K2D]